ncbi:MAG: GNAT family N-acetyltransferase [Sporichthyaceae bacterium]
MSETKIEVVDVPERSRFEITVDGQLAGLADYRLVGDRIEFVHTEIASAFEGQGLGGKLARAALDAVRARGLQVTPFCPFVAGWIKKHPEYVDLVDAEHANLVS